MKKEPTALQQRILDLAPTTTNANIAREVCCSQAYVARALVLLNYNGKRPEPQTRSLPLSRIHQLMHKCTDSEIAFLFNCNVNAIYALRVKWNIAPLYASTKITVQAAVNRILDIINGSSNKSEENQCQTQ